MGSNEGQINTHIYFFSFHVFRMEILGRFETEGHGILVTPKVVVGIRLSD